MTQTVRDQIRSALAAALAAAQDAGALPRIPTTEMSVERPSRPEHGDYASSVALRMAGIVGRKPLDVAEAIASRIECGAMIETVDVAAPGFINLRLTTAWKAAQVDAVLAAGDRWGTLDRGAGKRLQVEFVSANPTGPLQVGNGRGAVLGDTLAAVLAAAGYDVQREYYVNDAGAQIHAFAETLYARYQQALGREVSLPEGGYAGGYMVDLAREIVAEQGAAWLRPEGEGPPDALTERGLALMIERIGADLTVLGVRFDEWFSEKSLYESNGSESTYESAMALLKERGVVREHEGAIWFASKQLGEDKDNVLVRRSGEPTYLASDIAYHYDKFVRRGFDRVINVWGADHQGHVSRVKAAAEVVGAPRDGLTIVLYQLVHLQRGDERVRMSKRTGEIVTLRELIEDVGKDVARFFLLQRSADAQMDFDLDRATSQDPKQNPVHYVQYAHARAASILRTANEAGLQPTGGRTALLTEPEELTLVAEMLRLPELIESMAESLEPHHLTTYALELAQAFTQYYGACRVVNVDHSDLSRARLKLTLAAKLVLARTLGLIGVDAPETM